MGIHFPLLVLLCAGSFAGVNAVLPNCAVDTFCSAITNSNCTAGQGQPCVCLSSFHENATSTGCQPDVTPGMACSVKNSSTECVNDATCQDTAAEGDTEMLNCTCNDGYHPSAPAISGGAPTGCEPDFTPGENCTTPDKEDECVEGATCKTQTDNSVSVLECTCDPEFHVLNQMGVTSCAPDIIPGSTCTEKDSPRECVDDATCVKTSPESETAVLNCVCNGGFHSLNGSTACIKDVAPGKSCTVKDSEMECVGGAICIDKATDGATETDLQCSCKDGLHQKPDAVSPICEEDFSPGKVCTIKDDNSECKVGATCLEVVTDEADILQCTCDGDFHLINNETCQPDLSPGMPCTRENVASECKDHATCVNTAPEGHALSLQCMCNTHYHPVEEDSTGSKCVQDTCQDSFTKCSMPGTSDCSVMNGYIRCVLSGMCNGSVPEDVSRAKEAFSSARDNIAHDCGYTPGTNPTCVDRLTLCLNTFLKAELTCGATVALRVCVDTAGCADTLDTVNMAELVREVQVQTYAQLSCACIVAADTCMQDPNTAYNSAADDAAKCAAVTSMFQCAWTPACDAGKEIDAQKLSSEWTNALNKTQASSCTIISEADATTCPLKLTRCSVAYATGLKSADNKAKQCTSVVNFGHCIAAVGSACDANSKRIPLWELTAAVSSYSCECVMGLGDCWASFNDSLQREGSAGNTCSAIGDYQTCLVRTHCNMNDPLDSARVLEVQAAANKTKTDNSCQFPAGTTCQDNVKACADAYITKMTAAGSSDAICSAHVDLMMCVRAAKCNASLDADNRTFTDILQSAAYRHQGLRCQAMSCSATYASLMTCQTSYAAANTAAGNNTVTKCTAANSLVDCLNGLLCNVYLLADIWAQNAALKNTNTPSCALKALADENTSPAMRASGLILAAAMTTMLWFVRT